MAESFTPTQDRYNDPYQQRIFDYGTVDSKVYLSRASNMLLRMLGDNMVLNGFDVSVVSGVGLSTITLSVAAGYAIQDSTLVRSTQVATLSIDVTSLVDTTTDGAHLGVFLDYSFLETVSSNPLIVRLYHVSSDGTVITPAGFDSSRCSVLLGVVNFTKVGAVVTAVAVDTDVFAPRTTLLVDGTTMTEKGLVVANINMYGILDFMIQNANSYDKRLVWLNMV